MTSEWRNFRILHFFPFAESRNKNGQAPTINNIIEISTMEDHLKLKKEKKKNWFPLSAFSYGKYSDTMNLWIFECSWKLTIQVFELFMFNIEKNEKMNAKRRKYGRMAFN